MEENPQYADPDEFESVDEEAETEEVELPDDSFDPEAANFETEGDDH